jgi:hypothetical protein
MDRIIIKWISDKWGLSLCPGFDWVRVEITQGLFWTRCCSFGFHIVVSWAGTSCSRFRRNMLPASSELNHENGSSMFFQIIRCHETEDNNVTHHDRENIKTDWIMWPAKCTAFAMEFGNSYISRKSTQDGRYIENYRKIREGPYRFQPSITSSVLTLELRLPMLLIQTICFVTDKHILVIMTQKNLAQGWTNFSWRAIYPV